VDFDWLIPGTHIPNIGGILTTDCKMSY
jgi:hypothetical protein